MKSRTLTSLLTFIKILYENYAVDVIVVAGLLLYVYTKFYFDPLKFDVDKSLDSIVYPDTLKVNYEWQKSVAKEKAKQDSIKYGGIDEPITTYQGSAE